MKSIYLIFNLLLFSITISAQGVLTLNEAIQIGLQNNYSIVVARNSSEIAVNNNTAGNAGQLPQLAAGGSYTQNNNSTHQEYFDGRVHDADNAKSYSMNGNLTLTWTIFDGFAMFIEKSRYDEWQQSSEWQLQNVVENTVAEIITIYYGIVQQQKRLQVLSDAAAFTLSRKELAYAKYELGSASELSYLQAVVDLNTDSVDVLKQISMIRNSKAQLNTILARDYAIDFAVEDTIVLDIMLNINNLIAETEQQNAQINISQRNMRIAELNYKLTHAPNYPKINLFAGYNFGKSASEVGLLQSNLNYGPSYGVNFSYTIFDGFVSRQNSRNAQLQIKNAELQLQQTTNEIRTRLYQLFNDYQTNIQLIRFEIESVNTARKNTFVAFEKYKLGELSDIDLREIQLKQLETENQLLNAQYQAKQIEIELLRLSGKLIK